MKPSTLAIYLTLLLLNLAQCEETIVKVRIKNAEIQDLSNNSYPVRFSQHKKTSFIPLRKSQWLYGILTKKSINRSKIYKIELPELGRLIYTNPDSGDPVILDQVEYHHPSFEWSLKTVLNLDSIGNKSLFENLAEEKFMYQTLVGDVRVNFDIREIKNGRNAEYVRALRFNAPRKKVVRQILQYKNIL